ncbi:MAG: DsbA family protein [Gaiellaceae bacterium]
MAAMNPSSSSSPSGRTVVLAFAGAAAVAIALIVVALVFRNDGAAPEPNPTPGVELTGIPQDDRVLGDDVANVTLIEYADAQCPACRFYSEDMFPALVDEYVRPGKVAMEYRGFPFLGPDSVKALRFILAAGLQNRLWQLQEALYRNQGDENSGWVTDELLRKIGGEIQELDVDKLFVDAESGSITQEAEAAEAESQAAGIPGTPTFLIKVGDAEPFLIQIASVDDMRASLDDALGG